MSSAEPPIAPPTAAPPKPPPRPFPAAAVLAVLTLVVMPALGALVGVNAGWAVAGLVLGVLVMLVVTVSAARHGLPGAGAVVLLALLLTTLILGATSFGDLVLRARGERVATTVTKVTVNRGKGSSGVTCSLRRVEGGVDCSVGTRVGAPMTVIADPGGLVAPVRASDPPGAGGGYATAATALAATLLVAVGTPLGARSKERRDSRAAA